MIEWLQAFFSTSMRDLTLLQWLVLMAIIAALIYVGMAIKPRRT